MKGTKTMTSVSIKERKYEVLSSFFFLVLSVYCYQPITLHPHTYMLSHVTPWTAARQAPLSMDFSRQEYWSGLPFLPPGHLPYPGIEPASPALAGRFFTTQPPGKPTEEDTQTQRNEVLAKNEGLSPPLSSQHFTQQMV